MNENSYEEILYTTLDSGEKVESKYTITQKRNRATAHFNLVDRHTGKTIAVGQYHVIVSQARICISNDIHQAVEGMPSDYPTKTEKIRSLLKRVSHSSPRAYLLDTLEKIRKIVEEV